MPLFMIQGSYTPEAWAAQIRNPADRLAQLRTMTAQISGTTIIDAWYAFGEYDIFVLAESNSNVDAVAVVLGAFAAGALRSLKTTPLMSMAEGQEAMRKAQDFRYTPPGAE